LKEEDKNWPQYACFDLDDEVLLHEIRKIAVGLTVAVRNLDLVDVIEGFSSHVKLLRVFVYMFRFMRKFKDKSIVLDKTLSPTEYN